MAQTTIKVKCTDQKLTVVDAPIVASGGFNEDKVLFEFCPLWDGFTKTATFFVGAGETFYVDIDDDGSCIIPHEVLKNPGNMYFGAIGVNAANITRTSNVVKYKVGQGALSDDHRPDVPTPSIYEQILAKVNAMADAEALIKDVEAKLASGEFKGDKGDAGVPGKDGKTPERGTDYWIPEDQAAIVADVLSALPTWEGGSY